jgi:ATP-dependent exoDNAse (exonuclease V) alpha subunit
MANLKEHESVVLLRDNREHGLLAGDVGTIVSFYERHEAIDVEFTKADGRPVAILTLKPDDIRPLNGDELLHVRQVGGGESRV